MQSSKAAKEPLVDPVELGKKAAAAFKEWLDKRKCVKLERFTEVESVSVQRPLSSKLFWGLEKIQRVGESLIEKGCDKALVAATGAAASALSELIDIKSSVSGLVSKIGLDDAPQKTVSVLYGTFRGVDVGFKRYSLDAVRSVHRRVSGITKNSKSRS
jgi:hypothetical protein